jgi:hypothetical protein
VGRCGTRVHRRISPVAICPHDDKLARFPSRALPAVARRRSRRRGGPAVAGRPPARSPRASTARGRRLAGIRFIAEASSACTGRTRTTSACSSTDWTAGAHRTRRFQWTTCCRTRAGRRHPRAGGCCFGQQQLSSAQPRSVRAGPSPCTKIVQRHLPAPRPTRSAVLAAGSFVRADWRFSTRVLHGLAPVLERTRARATRCAPESIVVFGPCVRRRSPALKADLVPNVRAMVQRSAASWRSTPCATALTDESRAGRRRQLRQHLTPWPEALPARWW